MNTSKIYLLLVSVLFAACSPKAPKEIQYVDLQVDKEIDAFSDSTFFSELKSMLIYDGELYVSDAKRSQIFRLDKDLNLLNTIGKQGEGPEEIMNASSFSVSDGTILVNDVYKKTLKMYKISGERTGHISGFKTDVIVPSRFSFDGDIVRVYRQNGDNSMLAVNISDTTKQVHFGENYKFDVPMMARMRNNRNIFHNKKSVIATSNNVPFIEKFDKKGTLVEKYDLNAIEMVKRELDYQGDKPKAVNSFSAFSPDTYLYKNKLYILFTTRIDEYFSNKIIELDVSSHITPTKIYTLPGKIYDSFCVDDDYVYAFNTKEALIQRFKK